MWVLYNYGRLADGLLGRWVSLVIDLASGCMGSMLSVVLNPPHTISAGASGAIFGIIGALGGFSLRRGTGLPPQARSGILRMAVTFTGFNFIYGYSMSHIDWSAHLGGLLSGAVLGYLGARPFDPARRAASTPGRFILMLIALCVMIAGALATRLPHVASFRRITKPSTKWSKPARVPIRIMGTDSLAP